MLCVLGGAPTLDFSLVKDVLSHVNFSPGASSHSTCSVWKEEEECGVFTHHVSKDPPLPPSTLNVPAKLVKPSRLRASVATSARPVVPRHAGVES